MRGGALGEGARDAGDGTSGPTDGQTGAPTHVIVVKTLERPAPPSRARRLRGRGAQPSAGAGGWLTRVTVVDTREAVHGDVAASWLMAAGEAELEEGIAVLNRALRAYRVAAVDALAAPIDPRRALAVRLGYGIGEDLAYGRLGAARELSLAAPARPLRKMIEPEGRLAALLTGQERSLVAEELALRARLDLDLSFSRAAALQLLIALDAAIAELGAEGEADRLVEQLGALRRDREPVVEAAQAALAGEPSPEQMASVAGALERVEAALRMRSASREG